MSCSNIEEPSPADAIHLLEQQWVPVGSDNDHDTLPSFADIKNKTMRDLYGVGGVDKSPKGSVDMAIRPLVDLLNVHPSFATLSSCSGRIALFDPHMMKQTTTILDMLDGGDMIQENSSGKGSGGWLLACHEEVDPPTLARLLDEPGGGEPQEPLVFKHEPLLLHVAAASLTCGRQLLSLALQLGFRESGLVVSPHRVTVAIRGHSLALCVPLSRQGPLRPSDAYLEALMQEANQRMRLNQEKLKRLELKIQETLFRPAMSEGLRATFRSLPPLNLWGHAAVAVPVELDAVDILVLGGYGEGPDLDAVVPTKDDRQGGKRCCRSSHIYSLSCRCGIFDNRWREIEIKTLTDNDRQTPLRSGLGVDVVPTDFTAREGLAACLLPLDKSSAVGPVVAVWGGRASPRKPFSDLLLYEPSGPNRFFTKPCDVRGELPQPRWGHSLTALSGKDGLMAALVGGRDEQTSFGSLNILSYVMSESEACHFHWAKVELGVPAQFHHITVAVEDSILVFGGLADPNDLLESFSNSYRTRNSTSEERPSPVSAFHIDGRGSATKQSILLESTNKANLRISHGATGCLLQAPDVSGKIKRIIALAGGVPFGSSAAKSIRWYECASEGGGISLIPREVIINKERNNDEIDFAAMVHHCCVSVPLPENSGEMVLVGGGVPSFAFGASFAG